MAFDFTEKAGFETLFNILCQTAADHPERGAQTQYYLTDYNFAHSYIYYGQKRDDRSGDAPGNNIFSLYNRYSNSCGFRIVLSTSSIIEFLDILAHSAERYESIYQSDRKLRSLHRILRNLPEDIGDLSHIEDIDIRRTISRLPLDQGTPKLKNFVNLIENKKILSTSDVIPNDVIQDFVGRNRQRLLSIIQRVRNSHEKRRDVYDNELHDAADAWNIVLSCIDEAPENNLSFVCNHRLRNCYDRRVDSEVHSRHSWVPLLRLISFALSPDDGDIQMESQSILDDWIHKIHYCVSQFKDKTDVTSLTMTSQINLDQVCGEFEAMTRYDYSKMEQTIGAEELIGDIYSRYPNVNEPAPFSTRDQAVRAAAKGDATDLGERLKEASDKGLEAGREVLRHVPRLFEDPLLQEPYDLSNNPRIQAIKRRFDSLG